METFVKIIDQGEHLFDLVTTSPHKALLTSGNFPAVWEYLKDYIARERVKNNIVILEDPEEWETLAFMMPN